MNAVQENRFELFVHKLSDDQLEKLLGTVTRELRKRDAAALKDEFVTKSQKLRLKGMQSSK
jgi:hypothetical protein